MGIPSSRARISTTWGPQNPPWHRPIPALARRFTASTLRAEGFRRIAARISPSVIISHRQTIRPKAGSLAANSARSSSVISRNFGKGLRIGSNSGFSAKTRPASSKCFTTALAMAGAEVRPGDSMPAAWISRGALWDGPMTKSPVLEQARRPVKEVIVIR